MLAVHDEGRESSGLALRAKNEPGSREDATRPQGLAQNHVVLFHFSVICDAASVVKSALFCNTRILLHFASNESETKPKSARFTHKF